MQTKRSHWLSGFLLLVIFGSLAAQAADPSAPADFTIGTRVVAPSPERFGLNLRDPSELNNFTADPGFEPTMVRRQHRAMGGGTNYIENVPSNGENGVWSAGTAHYNTMADGFFDGAHVRVYRPATSGTSGLTFVREGTVTNYITNGWRRLNHVPVNVSQFTDLTAASGVIYEYQIRAVNMAHNVSANHSTNDAVATVTAQPGSATATNSFWPNSFYRRGGLPAPVVPTNVTATAQPGAVFLNWNDNTETGLAGYFVYRREQNGPRNRIILDSDGPMVQAGDIYFLEMTRDNAPVDYMHDRLGDSTLNGSWAVLGGTGWPYGQPATATNDATTVCPENGGRTSMRLSTTGANEVSLRQARFSAPQFYGGYYPALETGRTYRVDVWMKQTGVPNGAVRFAMSQHYSGISHTFTVGSAWQKCTWTFTAPSPSTTGSIAEIMIAFNGPGTVWVDNLLVYEDFDSNPATYPAFALRPATAQALDDFDGSFIRIWTGVDTEYWGVTLDDWLDPEPVIANHWSADVGRRGPDDPYKLPTALNICRDAGGEPWLIVGSFFTEEEWRGLIEYLAAPYDPLVDTPQSKPYAYRRYSQGQQAPWTDVFPRLMLEYGNELWNPAFQWEFPSGNTTGQFSEHFIQAAKASPYYAAVASKLSFIVNGWIISTNATTGYGHAASLAAPSSQFNDVAVYIGGWEAGIAVGGNSLNDVGYQDYMMFAPTYLRNFVDQQAAAREANAAAGHPYRIAVYEGGPGYANPSPGSPFEPISEAYGKSLAAAVATLDTYLYNSLRGLDPQCYFSFGYGYNWSSHSTIETGYHPHANWLALQMRNRYASGDMIGLATHSVPTMDVAARLNNNGGTVAPAAPNTPLVAVYPFRDGNKYSVFVLSRKLNANTPVTLRLPFSQISGGTLYKLTGDPRLTNSTSLNITQTQEPVSAAEFNQNFTFTMPPGSVYLYVFEGANTPAPSANPTATISRAIGQTDSTSTPAVQFSIDFSEPVTGFDANDLQIGGSAQPQSVTLAQGSPFFGTNYVATVTDFFSAGTITLNFAAGIANAADDNAPSLVPVLMDNSIDFAFPPPQNAVFASEDFNIAPGAAPNAPYLHGLATTGSGWAQPWQWQNFNAANATDGYKLAATAPLLFSNLRSTGSYMVAGHGYEYSGRALNVGAFGHYQVLNSNPAVIGQSGTVLWMSIIVRKDTNDNAPAYAALVNGDIANPYARTDLAVGYFGTFSNAGNSPTGTRTWTLSVARSVDANGASTNDLISTNVPVVIGQPTLFVLRMQFGQTDRFDLFVNPTSLGSAAPATPTVTRTTVSGAHNITFRTLRLYAGLGAGFYAGASDPGTNKASFDEIRFGDTYAAVTPTLAPVEFWRQQRFGSWRNSGTAADGADGDRDGRINALEYALDSDPLSGDFTPATAVESNGTRLQLTFRRNLAAADATYIVEACTDLPADQWTPIATKIGAAVWQIATDASVVDDGSGSVTVTDTMDVGAAEKRFLRLRVVR